MSSTLPPKLRCMRSISSAMAWETAARRSSTELRSKFGFIVELLPYVVLCAVLAITTPGPAMRHAPQRRAAAQEEPRQEHEGRTHRATFHPRHRQPSGVALLVSASAVQPTRGGGNGQARGSTNTLHRRGLPLAVETVFNMTSTRRGSISQDIARPATTTTRHAVREKPTTPYRQASRPKATSRHVV